MSFERDYLQDLFAGAGLPTVREGLLSFDARSFAPGHRSPLEVNEFAASAEQRQIWLDIQKVGASDAYNVPLALAVDGHFEEEAFGRALLTAIRRHEPLRTGITERGGVVIQRIYPMEAVAFSWSPPANVDRMRLSDIAHRPFAFDGSPLLRIAVAQEDGGRRTVLLTLHHLIVDGWSLSLLMADLAQFYEAALAERALDACAPSLQFADYSEWQRERLEFGALESLRSHWKKVLTPAPPLLALKLGADPGAGSIGGTCTFRIPAQVRCATEALASDFGTTPFAVLLAAYQAILARYAGTDDVAIGAAVAGRGRPELAELVGCFVNTLVLRGRPAGSRSFAHLVTETRQCVLEALACAELPFEQIAREASGGGFQLEAFLVMQERGLVPFRLGEASVHPAAIPLKSSKFPVSLTVYPEGDTYRCDLEHRLNVLSARRAEQMARHFVDLLREAVANPSQPVGQLRLGADEERRSWRLQGPRIPLPSYANLAEWFEAQAARTPDAVALVHGARRLTYSELNERANALAHDLLRLGAGPDQRVALFLPRDERLVIAVLGVLKSQAAYVPLDPAYPLERMAAILDDASPIVTVTDDASAASLPPSAPRIPVPAGRLPANPDPLAGPNHLAYLIYTSGSTGHPKGVAIEHRSALAFLAWAHHCFDRDDFAGVAFVTSVCFDLSVFEMLAPLTSGGTVVVLPNALALRAASPWPISLLNTVPSAMAELVRSGEIPASINSVNLAGEPLPQSLVDRIHSLCPHVSRIWNFYGPTEDTTYSTGALMRPGLPGPTSIGLPIANRFALVLDSFGQPVPPGVAGELFLGGLGLARGYWNQPALTAERLLDNRVAPELGPRLYRTGDLVRLREDNSLDYLGRLDDQVKLRGFRIELGDVAAALGSAPGVLDAVAHVFTSDRQEPVLAAYVVPSATPLDHAVVLAHLRARLPHYMVPQAIVCLPSFPLNPNGKVDRKRLPPPQGALADSPHTPPSTSTERRLAALWAELLPSSTHLARESDFFALGGHSLLAFRGLARIERDLGVRLDLRDLFLHTTLADLASLIDRRRADGSPAPSCIPRRPRGHAAPAAEARQEDGSAPDET